ncbi:hypothetical protein PHLGIDRAFT_98439 [Phlebiopsis gigantea 11061_1 CR5-6]|uniref:Uncharacterized protein n=1 Tax=Phlebiopsis gigantea (strain 11061_1 CR5-6) TaxID=745531 RepID=A0A0C3SFH6_PHLG1|nr:hypothetical protein PHLGIDRAFT_98439 [Phlebiopsis gigantea 11061_1 CR5-6]
MLSFNSPPSSPLMSSPEQSRSARPIPLRLPAVASMIVKLRRSSSKAKEKEYPIESSSGEPQTHPVLHGEGVTSARKVPLQDQRRFLCRNGVDVKRLLRTIRGEMLEEAQMIGANVLVDEWWTCYIHAPKRDGVYKVDIRYCASAARSATADPQQPIALGNARSVPGLMTVIG